MLRCGSRRRRSKQLLRQEAHSQPSTELAWLLHQPQTPPCLCNALRTLCAPFFATISSPDALPEFLPLQAHRVRADAVGRVAKSLVEAYEAVYAALDDPTNGYLEQGGTSAVKHSPAHVRTIFGVL
mmetsp:Transcript_4768/g.13037  ORF Transcript_4768/g.13037 Transcript_4768/m.13037 type:complete len:126 (-) Transcript_4768:300-677(-)